MVAKKKDSYKGRILQQLSSKSDQKEYWKLINKLASNFEHEKVQVGDNRMLAHFQKLLYQDVHDQFPATAIGDMDYAITMDELDKASTILKAGKAPGYDNVLNEMIRCLMEKYPKLIIKLFNRILQSNCIIPDWLISLIVPIHKKGSKTDPTNYRGISLLSCLEKLFLTILHNRLWKFVNEKIIDNKPTWICYG